jgi:hypothetical protein
MRNRRSFSLEFKRRLVEGLVSDESRPSGFKATTLVGVLYAKIGTRPDFIDRVETLLRLLTSQYSSYLTMDHHSLYQKPY